MDGTNVVIVVVVDTLVATATFVDFVSFFCSNLYFFVLHVRPQGYINLVLLPLCPLQFALSKMNVINIISQLTSTYYTIKHTHLNTHT